MPGSGPTSDVRLAVPHGARHHTMSPGPWLTQRQLHKAFLSPLAPAVVSKSDLNEKPLDVDLSPPLPRRVRLYIYNATQPPGGRPTGEHKIQLIVPGQTRGQRASFDHSDGRIVILAGHDSELEVFVLWDAGMYQEFAWSRNVQVGAQTMYRAYAGEIAMQQRRIRGQGIETVVATPSTRLAEAILRRLNLTRLRLATP